MTKPIILNAFDMMTPVHQSPGLWRHPESRVEEFTQLSFWTDLATTLEEGGFSSLFLATPLLVTLVNRRKKYREHNRAVEAFRSGEVVEDGDDPDNAGTRSARRTVTVPDAPAGAVEGPVAPATSTWRPNNR